MFGRITLCGIWNEEKMLRADALTAGRLSYFKTRHYNKCTAELRKSEKDKTTNTCQETFYRKI